MLRFIPRKTSLQEVVAKIENADDSEINEIISAVVRRYGKVYPEWEVMFLSLRKDPEKRKADVEGIIRLLRKTEYGE